MEHFLLLCNSFKGYRRSLFAGANNLRIQTYGSSEAPGNNILKLPLNRDENLPLEANALTLNFTIKFIFETERFDQPIHFLQVSNIKYNFSGLKFLDFLIFNFTWVQVSLIHCLMMYLLRVVCLYFCSLVASLRKISCTVLVLFHIAMG